MTVKPSTSGWRNAPVMRGLAVATALAVVALVTLAVANNPEVSLQSVAAQGGEALDGGGLGAIAGRVAATL